MKCRFGFLIVAVGFVFAEISSPFVSVVLADGPGDGGGGGSVVRCDSHSGWVLLDQANQDPTKAMRKMSQESLSSSSEAELERVDIKQTKAYRQARSILERWRNNSPEFVELVEGAIENVPYFKTPSSFALSDQFTISDRFRASCPNYQVRTAIRYLPQYGAIISSKIWAQLDDETKAGLLLHEAFRQIQMSYSFDIKNGELEALVSRIMSGDPLKEPAIQESPLIDGRLRNYFKIWHEYRAVSDETLQAQSRASDQPCRLDDASSMNTRLHSILGQVLALSQEMHRYVDGNLFRNSQSIDLKATWQELVDRKIINGGRSHP